MLLLLPLAAWFLFFLILREKDLDWRKAGLAAAVFCAACVAAITEILSVPRLINSAAVSISWLLICGAALAYLRFAKGRSPRQAPAKTPEAATLDRASRMLLAGALVIVLLVGITALIAPPDTWDAMEYHLPRTVMWMSNHTVRFFPTPDYCQLIYSPWAEYAMMHTQLLWGSDRFVNFIEWFSFLGSLVAVSLIARKLGAGIRGQVLAVVACATIPEGLLEASGPMNTYVVSFWIATTAVFLLEWNDQPRWLYFICAALSAGLAIFTKGTAYIFLPFIVLACWWMGDSRPRLLLLKRMPIFVLLVLALNTPQYLRSYEFTGSPLGVPIPAQYPRTELAMEHVTLTGTLANVLRNASLHFVTPSRFVNSRIERSFRVAIRGLGVDPDDPDQNWVSLPFHMNHFTSNEIIAGNPLHLLLLVASFGLVLGKRNEGVRRRWAISYALGILGSFVLFCALLRWQMWSSRYHLPLFVLASALIGLALERYFSRRVANAAAIVLLLIGAFLALTNRSRSLIPWKRVEDVYHSRAELYFSNEHESVAATHIAAATFVNKLQCKNVGIDSYLGDPEVKNSPESFFVYPFLALIHADGKTHRVWYTGVNNLSSRYAEETPHTEPCAVICFDCAKIPQKWAEYSGIGGRASVFGSIVVFNSAGEMPDTTPPDHRSLQRQVSTTKP